MSCPRNSEHFTFFFGEDSFLSNFYPSPIQIGQLQFTCVEHFYQFKKAEFFDDFKSMKRIYESFLPKQQKRWGKSIKGFNRQKWSTVCCGIMFEGLRLKFKHAPLFRKLKSTVPTLLVEANPHDAVWGIKMSLHNPNCLDRGQWNGRNLLGCLLTEIRDWDTVCFDDCM